MNQHSMGSDELRSRLHHVRFIGGGSGAGKSTVARLLAAEYGFQLYYAERFSEYVECTTPAGAPLLHAFLAMDMDERWLNRSPQVMFDTFHGFHGEQFHLVIDDLLALPTDPPILAEGFTLVPRLVAPVSPTASRTWRMRSSRSSITSVASATEWLLHVSLSIREIHAPVTRAARQR